MNNIDSGGKLRFPHVRRSLLLILVLLADSPMSMAADARYSSLSKGAVELETDGSDGISVAIAQDLARLIDDGATRRVLPVVGRDATQNLLDLIGLHGIDMAILQSDVLDLARQHRTPLGVENSFTYITQLYDEEFHLLTNPDVKSIADLAHRRVIVGAQGSGTNATATRLFELLKIPIDPVFDRVDTGLDALRRGDVAAVAFVTSKPSPLFQAKQDGDHFHFLGIPLEESIVRVYSPSTLTARDYPGLIEKDQPVETVAVSSLLAAANLLPRSDRYRAVSNFVETFFTGFPTLLELPHNSKWRDINLAADIPGLTRFPPAQQWLDRNAGRQHQAPQDVSALFSKFIDGRQQALNAPHIPEQQKLELFNQFKLWQSGKIR